MHVANEPLPGQQAPRRSRREDGLTLVEIVMATALLSIFLTGLFGALAHSQRTDVMARERAAASEACFRQLDLLMSGGLSGDTTTAFAVEYDTGFTNAGVPVVATLKPASPYPANPTGFLAVNAGTSTMAGSTVTRHNPDGDGSTLLVEVRVTVAWRSIHADNSGATIQQVQAVARRIQ